MEDKNMEVKLHSLFREQLYHSAAEATNWTDTSVHTLNKFYQALALLFTSKAEDALNLLTPLHAEPPLNLSAIIAYLQALQKC
jgi:hypothetical protein